MKARLIGFEWSLGQGVSLDQLIQRLHTLRDEKVRYGNYDRLIYVAKVNSYHAGLFLTIKDQRKFAEVKNDDGKYKISVRDIEAGKSIVDFNFFAINVNTCRGVYLYYHHSCSLNQFNYFCRKVYSDLNQELLTDAIRAAESGGKSKNEIEYIKKAYCGTLKWLTMVRKEKLADLLDELDRIRAFDFEFFAVDAKMPVFTPYEGTAKRMTHRVAFKPELSMRQIKNAILQSVQHGALDRGRVEGETDGVDRIIKLADNLDYFAEYDHDYIAEQMDIDLDDISSSWGITELLSVVKKHSALFEAPIV